METPTSFVVDARINYNDIENEENKKVIFECASNINIFTNTKNEDSINCSAIMNAAGITGNKQKSLIDQVLSVDGELGFSCRAITQDMYDHSTYDEYDKDLKEKYVSGYQCVYDWGTGRGSILYHIKNSLLPFYSNFEFMISQGIISYDFIYEDRDIRAKLFSEINVPRSDGSVQKGVLGLDQGLIVKDSKIYVKVFFNSNIRSEMKYNKRGYSNYTDWVEPYTDKHKYLEIQDFLKANPSFRFVFRIDNPLTTHQEIYDKYVKGDEELEKQYEELNSYYYQKVTKFFQEDVIPTLKEHEEKRFTIGVFK
jgi:hypothetical protein